MRIVVLERPGEIPVCALPEACGAHITMVSVGSAAMLYLELLQHCAEIVVLDVGFLGLEAHDVSRHLRMVERTSAIGIVMLLPFNERRQRIAALQSGADVLLPKPVHADELMASLHGLNRRLAHGNTGSEPLLWKFLDSEWRLITPCGRQIELSRLEAAFVGIVARNAGRPVPRRDIIAVAFGQDPASYDNRRLEAIVSRLRRKLQGVHAVSQPIKVVHSVGYVFTDPIRYIGAVSV